MKTLKRCEQKAKISLRKIYQNNSAIGKKLMWPRHIFLQQSPIETWAWVFFSARCNVFMACNVRNRVVLAKRQTKGYQAFVLSRFKAVAL